MLTPSWSGRDMRALAAALGALGAVTFIYVRWLGVTNATTVALTFLLIILMTATAARLAVAAVASGAAMLCFNYFFLPPVGTWTIADAQNWVALFAFLAVSLVASRLSTAARTRTHEAVARRDELARLFDLSRDVLVMTAGADALDTLARAIARRFDLDVVAIALPEAAGWKTVQAGADGITWDAARLSQVFRAAEASLEFDARERTYAGHQHMTAGGRTVRLVPLRAGTRPIGLLAASGREIEPGTLDALAGVVAIAIERSQMLEERKAAELTRRSEELKTALLAALGHDLRTPLTAIRVAAANLTGIELGPSEREEQGAVILAEVDRLTRLFDNVLQMARIDAGAVAAETRWTHPSEIVAAARDLVGRSLGHRALSVDIEPDVPVRLDPRLTATALAHVIENATRYTPGGSPIAVTARLSGEGLCLEVRDHGPGIPPADVPRLFDRFYRGQTAGLHPPGSGMGLWIARGLLAAEGGRIWAENHPGGGARFTIVVPAARKAAEELSPDDAASANPAGR